MSLEESAIILGIKSATARARYSRARAKLRAVPHDMVITVEDNPHELVDLLWIRESWNLQPIGDDLPPSLSDESVSANAEPNRLIGSRGGRTRGIRSGTRAFSIKDC